MRTILTKGGPYVLVYTGAIMLWADGLKLTAVAMLAILAACLLLNLATTTPRRTLKDHETEEHP